MCEHRKGPHGAASKHASDNMPLQTRGARSERGVRNEGCGCGCRMCRAQQTSICPVADRDTLKQAQSTPSTASALPTAHSSQAGRRWPGQRRRRQAPTHGPQTSRACGLVLQSCCGRGAADNVTVNKRGGRQARASVVGESRARSCPAAATGSLRSGGSGGGDQGAAGDRQRLSNGSSVLAVGPSSAHR